MWTSDWAIAHKLKLPGPRPAATGKSVAVVGGGQAGLAMAYLLRRRGHAVTVYERRSSAACFAMAFPDIAHRGEALDGETQRIVPIWEFRCRTTRRSGLMFPLPSWNRSSTR